MKKKFKLLLFAALLCSILCCNTVQAQRTKSPIKVLFVGYNLAAGQVPAESDMHTEEGSRPYAQDSIRMPAFKALLDKYFAVVKTEDYRQYKPEDSGPYDVTIFDYPTTAIEKGSGKGPSKYLPDNFTRPVIFIANTAPVMGESLGLKLDWLCLCLKGDAHHINLQHPIFRGPLAKVAPTLVMKPTPRGIYNYPSGDTVPKELSMWQVNTTAFENNKGVGHYRIGLVARGNGFTDSPDAEVISSGVCEKDVTAVALGRHGNFFLWGFAASPADMTEEAKKVFVNVVAYINQFNGQAPIVRKYNQYIATTASIKDAAGWCNKKFYQQEVNLLKDANRSNDSIAKVIAVKVAAKQPLTELEKEMQGFGDVHNPVPTWEDYLKQQMGNFSRQFGTDAEAFRNFVKDNIGYMVCDSTGYSFHLDRDAQKLGISNHNPELLKKCINMLKENRNAALALRILKRYTIEYFDTANEWEQWYKENKSRLFFTEAGGWKFMVNTLKNGKP